jgi:transposase
MFRAKRVDRVKLLVWDGSGLTLIYKRLDQARFVWPRIEDGVMRLSSGQLGALLEGLDWKRVPLGRDRVDDRDLQRGRSRGLPRRRLDPAGQPPPRQPDRPAHALGPTPKLIPWPKTSLARERRLPRPGG